MDGKVVVFDSGVGGLSTLKELLKFLPAEDFIYFADNGNAPYGKKSAAEISNCVSYCMEKICALEPKAVVIACNTVTSLCVKNLREQYPQIMFIGMQPAVRPAVNFNGKKTIVFVTLATAQSSSFNDFVAGFHNQNITVFPLIEGAGIVESGSGSGHFAVYLKEQLKGLDVNDFSGVVLGCTHFVIVKDAFSEVFPNAKMFDGNEGIARETLKKLGERRLLCETGTEGRVSFVLTDGNEKERNKFLKIFNSPSF